MASLKSIFRLPQTWSLRQTSWWRWLALVWILVLVAALGYLAPSYQPRFLLLLLVFAIAGLALIWLLSRWPALGLVLLIPANILVKYGIGTGTQTEINATILLIVLLLGIWLVGMIGQYQTIRLHHSRTNYPLIFFLVVAVLAFINGQLVWFNVPGATFQAQVGGLMVMILSVATFLLAANLIDDIRWLKWMTFLLIAFGAINTVFGLLPYLGRMHSRFFAWGGNGSQFWTWFMALVFSQAWLNRDLARRWKVLLWLVFISSLYLSFILVFDWKSGWMPVMVAIAFIVGLKSWRVGLVFGAVGLVVAPTLLAQLVTSEEYSFLTRLEAWQIVGEIAQVNPLLGLGPANYYWYTPLYTISGYTGLNFNSHNQYIDLIAQVGILGLIFYLWFFYEAARVGLEVRMRTLSGFERAYVYGALGGLVATLFAGLLGDWSLPFIYNVGIVGMRSSILGWLFLGGLVALERLTRQPQESELPVASP